MTSQIHKDYQTSIHKQSVGIFSKIAKLAIVHLLSRVGSIAQSLMELNTF